MQQVLKPILDEKTNCGTIQTSQDPEGITRITQQLLTKATELFPDHFSYLKQYKKVIYHAP